jgi:hypothetical protein
MNILDMAKQKLGGIMGAAKPEAPAGAPLTPATNDGEYLELFRKCKKESFDSRWIWERGWMRNIHYVNNRHWITYTKKHNEWRDVKLAKWIPKPVTNKMGEGVQALRAMFASVNIGTNVRPIGNDPKNIAVAAVADEYGPILHEEHQMDDVLNEADFWFIVTGNVFLHTFVDSGIANGFTEVPTEQCATCGAQYESPEIVEAKGACAECGGMEFVPAVDELTGEPIEPRRVNNTRGKTIALSPFELAFPSSHARFEDVPYVIRLRWRSKDYYEQHPTLKAQVADVKWTTAPSETSLQLFRSLPYHNDMGVAPFLNQGGSGNSAEEGAPEYELWMRPCDAYPEGLVLRVLGDSSPILLHLEDEEAIPGPIPYKSVDGKPVFTFSHAAFEQRGGRVYGTSPLDSVIPKQNMLNQLDSMIQMIVQRMSNPLWLVPKGAEIEKFTGEPGLVVKWNPLTVGGNNKPERVDGSGADSSLFNIREMYLKDIEEGLGTYDIVKGSKPAGVEAFSAMQLLVERSQSRFASAFKSRGNLYKDWNLFALEIEREFGPAERTRMVLSPARTWTQKQFKQAQLQGSFSVIVEDGSNAPKTTLGIRAAVEHLNQLGMIDASDPDQRHKVLTLFGQASLNPSLDIHMQAALRKQQAFEEWAQNPKAQQQSMVLAEQDMAKYQQELAAAQPAPAPAPQVGPDGQQIPADPAAEQQAIQAALPQPPSITKNTPLAWKPWFMPEIHKQEFLKWANSDVVIELLKTNPALEALLVAHLQEIDMALAEKAQAMAMAQAAGGAQVNIGKPGGSGRAMANSNKESGGSQNVPSKKGAAQEPA